MFLDTVTGFGLKVLVDVILQVVWFVTICVTCCRLWLVILQFELQILASRLRSLVGLWFELQAFACLQVVQIFLAKYFSSPLYCYAALLFYISLLLDL